VSHSESSHPAAQSDEELLAACDLEFTRRSGPGGQHRNKVETAAILTHRPSGISAEASEERSQSENRRAALRRLRLKLAIGVRNPLATAPSPLWHSRRQGTRISIATEHSDLPAILAEALDALAHHDYHHSPAAAWLGISGSQLISLLKQHPPALNVLNAKRIAAGKTPLG
jgi:hypothetical protein